MPAPQPETIATPQRLRRRPALAALAVIFIAVGALLAAYLVTTVGTTKPVVALRRDVPRDQDDPPTTAPASVTATVVSTRPVGDEGQVVVDVTVPGADAAELAAAAATGRGALVLDSAGGA